MEYIDILSQIWYDKEKHQGGGIGL